MESHYKSGNTAMYTVHVHVLFSLFSYFYVYCIVTENSYTLLTHASSLFLFIIRYCIMNYAPVLLVDYYYSVNSQPCATIFHHQEFVQTIYPSSNYVWLKRKQYCHFLSSKTMIHYINIQYIIL